MRTLNKGVIFNEGIRFFKVQIFKIKPGRKAWLLQKFFNCN